MLFDVFSVGDRLNPLLAFGLFGLLENSDDFCGISDDTGDVLWILFSAFIKFEVSNIRKKIRIIFTSIEKKAITTFNFSNYCFLTEIEVKYKLKNAIININCMLFL